MVENSKIQQQLDNLASSTEYLAVISMTQKFEPGELSARVRGRSQTPSNVDLAGISQSRLDGDSLKAISNIVMWNRICSK
jgi:hypothetical protein